MFLTNSLKVPQPGSGRRRGGGGGNESDYEEIGPPITRIGPKPSNTSNGSCQPLLNDESNMKSETNSNSTCDLCGTATSIVRCRQCTDQVFCLACDDMYHRHPKRSTHQRKVTINVLLTTISLHVPTKDEIIFWV